MRRHWKIWIGFLLVFLPTVSFAQALPKWAAEFRTDLDWQSREGEAQAEESDQSLRFSVQRATLGIQGSIDTDLMYQMRWQWTQDFSPKADQTGPGLEQWFLRYQWNKTTQLRLGKQFILQGGREGAHNPIDIYGYSQVGEQIHQLYEVGASAFFDLSGWDLPEQTLVVQVANQPGGGSKRQLALSYNLAWYGNLANGFLEPIVQFGLLPHADEEEKEATTGKNRLVREAYLENYLSLGVQAHLDGVTVEFDILNHSRATYREQTSTGVETNPQRDISSFIVLVKQEDPELRPFIKWIYDTLKQDKAEEEKSNQFQVGVEYFPKKHLPHFRLHGVVSIERGQVSGDPSSTTGALLGVSARFN